MILSTKTCIFRSLNTILEKMQNIYTNTEICIPYGTSNGVENAILKDMQKVSYSSKSI